LGFLSIYTQNFDVRIITATNRNLSQEVAAGRFRSNLCYRLSVFPILAPSFRQRVQDIPPLVWAFVKHFEKKIGKRIDHIPHKCMETMQRFSIPQIG
jgi:transcriptional regulator with GAF, ATPase, and Fis domain